MLKYALLTLLAAGGIHSALAENPVRLASEARFDVLATEATGALSEGTLLDSPGTIEREAWKPAEEQPRGYIVRFPVSRFEANQATFRFVPERSGEVTLELKGPWNEAVPGEGLLLREELLWESIKIDGKAPKLAWIGGRRDGAGNLPVTWHNDPARAVLRVEAGKAVTVSVAVRPVVPADLDEMPRIAGKDTPAHRAAKRLRRGINLGNCFEMPPGIERHKYGEADFAAIKAEGFDHVRLPVAWHQGAGPAPDFRIDPNLFASIDELVGWALEHRLAAIVNWHHFDAFVADPENPAHRAQFLAGWSQIAAHYGKHSSALVFELLNEPHGKTTTEMLNELYPEIIARVRVTNPERTLIVGPGDYNGIGELERFRLPADDLNLIVGVHFYDPFPFTHQGASWVGEMVSTTGIRFPGPPPAPLKSTVEGWPKAFLAAYNTAPEATNPCGANAIAARLRVVGQWSDYYGRPVHVGEFGCYEKADPESRVNYCGVVRRELEKLGLGWAMWDWKAGFHYSRDGKPDPPEMRDALFGTDN